MFVLVAHLGMFVLVAHLGMFVLVAHLGMFVLVYVFVYQVYIVLNVSEVSTL